MIVNILYNLYKRDYGFLFSVSTPLSKESPTRSRMSWRLKLGDRRHAGHSLCSSPSHDLFGGGPELDRLRTLRSLWGPGTWSMSGPSVYLAIEP